MLTNRPNTAFVWWDEAVLVASPVDASNEIMQVQVAGLAPVEFQTGSLEEPMRWLKECETGLMEKWGWGSAYSERVATAATTLDPQSWFYTAITYPAAARLTHLSGILQLRLKVDTNGRVSECVVQSSLGSSEFGSTNCQRMRRLARFTPALDAQGQPIEGYAQMSITFIQFD